MKSYTFSRYFYILVILRIFAASNSFAQYHPSKVYEDFKFKSTVIDGVKKQIKLEWNIGKEQDVETFFVERSNDNETFVLLAKMDVSQNSNGLFAFVDVTPLSGQSFYRIKKIRAGGSFDYSKALPVLNAVDRKYALSLYPNPTGQSLMISAQGSQTQGQISIKNMEGRTLFSIRVMSSSVETALDVSYLASGTYLLTYSDTQGEVVKQFIKK